MVWPGRAAVTGVWGLLGSVCQGKTQLGDGAGLREQRVPGTEWGQVDFSRSLDLTAHFILRKGAGFVTCTRVRALFLGSGTPVHIGLPGRW